jgi:hypothetical protein
VDKIRRFYSKGSVVDLKKAKGTLALKIDRYIQKSFKIIWPGLNSLFYPFSSSFKNFLDKIEDPETDKQEVGIAMRFCQGGYDIISQNLAEQIEEEIEEYARDTNSWSELFERVDARISSAQKPTRKRYYPLVSRSLDHADELGEEQVSTAAALLIRGYSESKRGGKICCASGLLSYLDHLKEQQSGYEETETYQTLLQARQDFSDEDGNSYSDTADFAAKMLSDQLRMALGQ